MINRKCQAQNSLVESAGLVKFSKICMHFELSSSDEIAYRELAA